MERGENEEKDAAFFQLGFMDVCSNRCSPVQLYPLLLQSEVSVYFMVGQSNHLNCEAVRRMGSPFCSRKRYFHFVYKLFNHMTAWRFHIIYCTELVLPFARENWYVHFLHPIFSPVFTLCLFKFVLKLVTNATYFHSVASQNCTGKQMEYTIYSRK